MKSEEPYCIIGLIDAYGAIHHRPIFTSTLHKTHDFYWPNQTHKTWRFMINDWQLENSMLSKEKLTPSEAEDIEAYIRKHYKPPLWVIKGEEWDALGRPRSGAAYERHCKKWDRIYRLKNT